MPAFPPNYVVAEEIISEWRNRISFHDYGSSSSLVLPADCTYLEALIRGGGGGGGGGNDTMAGGGGGQGAGARFIYKGTGLGGQTLTITIGAAGAAGSYGASAGTRGGNGGHTTIAFSSTGYTITAGGGEGGIQATNSPTSGYISGQGAPSGNVAETTFNLSNVTHSQFNIGQSRGQDAQVRRYGPASWTPVLTAQTPGNLNVVYSVQKAYYIIDGDIVEVHFVLVTSTWTHSTASGDLLITGLPFASYNDTLFDEAGWLQFGGITKATYTQFVPYLLPNTSQLNIVGSGSGVAGSNVAVTELLTTAAVRLRGGLRYRVTPGDGQRGGYGGGMGDSGGGGKGGAPGSGGGTGSNAAAGGYVELVYG